MIHRKFGKLLLGKATPFQVIAACVLGGILGFLPGIAQAPGSVLILLALLAVLNANLLLAATTTIGAKLLSFALLPVAHAVGVFLLEGPTEGLFRVIVNTPFLAWCGFEYHAVAGGWLVGGLGGLAVGLLLTRAMGKLRSTFLDLDENSEKFRKWANKGWVKFTTWLLIGGKPKKEAYEKLAGKKIGNPIRPLGVVLVAGVAILAFAVPALLSEPILTGALRGGLERANGATVDLAAAEVDLGEGRVKLSGLAMADRNQLDEDILRTVDLTADLDVKALLTRRWRVTEVTLEQAATGAKRERPGELIVPPSDEAEPAPAPEDTEPVEEGTDRIALDEILTRADEWRGRLEQLRKVLSWFGGDEEESTEAAGGETAAAEEVEGSVDDVGYAWTRAAQLIEEAPTFRLDHLLISRLDAMQLDGRRLVVEAWNLATQPSLVEEAAGFSLASEDDTLRFAVNPAESGGAPTPGVLDFARLGLSGDALGEEIRIGGAPVIAGGTVDISGRGRWWREDGLRVDIPVEITMRGCSIRVPGSEGLQQVDNLVLPISIVGRITRPRIIFREKALIDALVSAGKRELANRARAEFDSVVGEETEKLKEKLGEELEGKVDDETKKKLEKIGGGILDKLPGGGGD